MRTEKVPLVVTWTEKMLFYGKSLDPENRPAAKAEFYKNTTPDGRRPAPTAPRS